MHPNTAADQTRPDRTRLKQGVARKAELPTAAPAVSYDDRPRADRRIFGGFAADTFSADVVTLAE